MFRILIVDDHQVLAHGLERYLDLHFPGTVITLASNAKECLGMLNDEPYDLILMDINLPDMNGTELCRSILRITPGPKIIAITGMIEKSSVRLILDAGASGYILKTSIADELVEGIEAVMRGEVFVSREFR